MKVVLAEPIVTGLRLAGPVFFMSMQASSVQSALKILHEKSVGSSSPVPFMSLFTNCVIWSYYGFLKKDNTVLIPNVLGVLAGASSTIAFSQYGKLPNNLMIIFSAICTIATYFFNKGKFQTLGLIGCALAVILAGSPLATLANVIKEKTTKSLSFNFTFATWMNAISWLLYGVLVANDPMIYGPNAFGLFLASIQLLLFAVYGFPNDSRGNYKVVAQADEVEIKPIF